MEQFNLIKLICFRSRSCLKNYGCKSSNASENGVCFCFLFEKFINIVEYILIGYNVLMITNLNDTYIWVSWPNRLQTGLIVDYVDWLLLRTGCNIRSGHWPWLKVQDKISCSYEPKRWFQEQSRNKKHKVIWRTTQDRLAAMAC